MKAIIVFAVLLISLFSLAYLSKRRFGILGLALCAGALLSATWTDALTPILERSGSFTLPIPFSVAVASLLVLAPPVLLLFGGPTYSSKLLRLVGSAAFAVLAFVFLLDPLRESVIFDPLGQSIFDMALTFKASIIAAGIILAISDVVMTRSHKPHAGKRESRK